MSKRRDALALLMLAALTLLFFWKLALTNLIMVGVDIFTYFYPYRSAVNESLMRGHLPLWNPYLFMGVPFLANGQAGVFYPLNWPFIGLSAPQAINDSIVLHVFLAAICFYLFARDGLRLSAFAALIGASVYALSGYTGSLVEHVNQLQAAAWFPLLLWCYERALRGRPVRFILLGGAVFALQLLAGHAQVSYISLFGVGLWALGSGRWKLEVRSWKVDLKFPTSKFQSLTSTLQSLISRLLPLLAIIVIGIGLSAVQLLPMLELSRLSIRGGGMSFREAGAFSLPLNKLLVSVLPTFGLGEVIFSEYIAFVGVAALLLAVVGVWRQGRKHLGLLFLLVAGFTLALGLYNPLYFILYKLMPGFGLFRVPARWLFLFAFALAGFAGVGIAGGQIASFNFRRASFARWIITLCALASIVLFLIFTRRIDMPAMPAPLLWLSALALTLLLLGWRAPFARWALLALLLVELFMATRWLPYNQPTAPEAYSSLRPSIAYLRSEDGRAPFRLLSYSDLNWDPGDFKDIQTLFADTLSSEAIYQFTVATKSKEIIAPNLALRYRLQSVDGYDGGILPLARFVGLQGLFLTSEQINPDGRLRERLRAVPEARWLDLFNVRYIIADKIFDVWVDGIYYDLGLGLDLKADDHQAHLVAVPSDFEATGIGVISYLRGGAALPTDTPVAELRATDSLNQVYQFVLRAGRETAESEFQQVSVAHAQARAVRTLRDHPTANEYHALLQFDAPTRITSLSVRALQPAGELILHGISLVDLASRTGKPLTFASDGDFRVAQSGDIKLYELVGGAPRAQVVHQAEVMVDDAQTLKRMSAPTFDPRTQIVLASGQPLQSDAPVTTATITTYEAERITLQTNDPAAGYLFLKDSWYPGWRAWVDGQPAAIERADTYFRAIHLRAGAHSVELRFEPESLQIGAIISALAVLACAVVAVWDFHRR